MDYLEILNIKLCFTLPPDPGLLGDTLHHFGSVTPVGGPDWDDQNNSYTLSQLITGSYDPNYIEVYPKGEGVTGEIPLSTHRLEYTIHFQNVGTDTARNVSIINPINPNLDLRTLQILGTSHPYDLSFTEEGRILTWSFDNINLPDSIADREESNGFVKYTLDLALNVIGTEFTNQADIFFDFNSPVTTNETVNTLSEVTTSFSESTGSSICDYNVQILGGNLLFHDPGDNTYQIGIYSLEGHQLRSFAGINTQMKILLENLPSGCYIVSIASKECVQSKLIFIK